MPPQNIDALSKAGECAAQRLLETFLGEEVGNPDSDGWHNHRQIRFRTFLGQVAGLVQHKSLHDPTWDAMLDELRSKKYTAAEIAAATALINGLRNLGKQVGNEGPSLSDNAPKPHASLRISPKI
jgi:hypothetical protein